MFSFTVVAAVLCHISAATVCNGMGQCQASGSSCTDSVSTLQCEVCMPDSKITVTSITATQNGKSVDDLGGIHTQETLDLTIAGHNGYGRVDKPSVDVALSFCGKGGLFGGGKCAWKNQITLGLMSNLDPCSETSGVFMSDCHFSTDTGFTTMEINFSKNPVLAPLVGLLKKGAYYEMKFTIKDNGTPINCIMSAAKLLNP